MIIGWDIGAANIKAAWWRAGKYRREEIHVASQAFEIWRNKLELTDVLQSVWNSICGEADPRAAAVTMTAELSDAFRTKREGVLYVLNSFKAAFPGVTAYVFNLSGAFLPLDDACLHPLDYAASNWMATAKWVASEIQDCLIIDTGSTTTDILPIVGGRVAAIGRTDMERLAAGELVYTGALRTNLAAISPTVPVESRLCPVASEYFAISGDVHLLLGNLKTGDYTCPTPDGQPASVESARRRVARLVCADMEMLDPQQIDEMARYLEACQVQQIRMGIEQVVSRWPRLLRYPAIVLGSGSFLAEAAARKAGLEIGKVPGNLGDKELAIAPCIAVAQLLEKHLSAESI